VYGALVKGIVFQLLEQTVIDEHGEQSWEQVLDAAGLDGVYTSLGSYPDEQLFMLVAAASEALDTPPDDVVRWFGRSAMPLFAQRYPQLFTGHREARFLAEGMPLWLSGDDDLNSTLPRGSAMAAVGLRTALVFPISPPPRSWACSTTLPARVRRRSSHRCSRPRSPSPRG